MGESFQRVENVTPDMAQALNVPAPGKPYLQFFQLAVGAPAYRVTLPIADVVRRFLAPLPPAAPREPGDPADMVLRPWTDADRVRLKLAPADPGDDPPRPPGARGRRR